MNRRAFLALGLAAAISAAPAMAATLEERLVAQLRAQGYTEIRKSRTLLGRVRIEAERPGGEREIIFNPRTGEILRDYWEEDDDDEHDEDGLFSPRGGQAGAESASRSGNAGGGTGAGDTSDDRDDDDDDGDDRDDGDDGGDDDDDD